MSVVKTLNRIAEKQSARLELSSQIVELGIKADIAKATSALKSSVKQGDKADKSKDKAKKLMETAKSANSTYEIDRFTLNKDGEKALSLSEKTKSTITDAARELGVNPSEVAGYDDLNSLESQLMNRMDNHKNELSIK